jgi:hypothetical protein
MATKWVYLFSDRDEAEAHTGSRDGVPARPCSTAGTASARSRIARPPAFPTISAPRSTTPRARTCSPAPAGTRQTRPIAELAADARDLRAARGHRQEARSGSSQHAGHGARGRQAVAPADARRQGKKDGIDAPPEVMLPLIAHVDALEVHPLPLRARHGGLHAQGWPAPITASREQRRLTRSFAACQAVPAPDRVMTPSRHRQRMWFDFSDLYRQREMLRPARRSPRVRVAPPLVRSRPFIAIHHALDPVLGFTNCFAGKTR